MSVLSITSETASCNAPPSEVKSFWYSMSTTAVVFGSIAMCPSFCRWTPAPDASPASRRRQPAARPGCSVLHALPRERPEAGVRAGAVGVGGHRQPQVLQRHRAAVHHDPVEVRHVVGRVARPCVVGADALVTGAGRGFLQRVV